MDPLLNIAYDAARKAEKIILRGLEGVRDLEAIQKQPRDIVTEVDHKSEQIIVETIQKAYPHHNILCEERGYVAGEKREVADEGYEETLWIIDPLDGTKNFFHGLPHFSISIAIQQNGRIEHGLVYDPVRSELFSASRGRGAYLNERRIRVSSIIKLEDSLIGTGFPHYPTDPIPRYMEGLGRVAMEVSGIRRGGSAALDLAYVAAGRLEGYWEYGLKLWDIAAGVLLVREAGGRLSDRQGGEDYLETGDIVAGPMKILKQLLPLI